MTPSEQNKFKAEILREILHLFRNVGFGSNTYFDVRNRIRDRITELEAEAEQDRDRVAITGVAASGAEPESVAKDGDSDGRPQCTLHKLAFSGGVRWHFIHQDEHERLVAWLDAEIAKRDQRIAKLLVRGPEERAEWSALERRAEKAEADAAALRQALEKEHTGECVYTTCIQTVGCPYSTRKLTENEFQMRRDCEGRAKLRADALATGAGEKLLVKIEKLERFVRAADALEANDTLENDQEYRFARRDVDWL